MIRENLFALTHYPDPDSCALREELACRHGLAPENVLVGNGSNELIHLIPRALRPQQGLIPIPNFTEYERALSRSGCPVIHGKLDAGKGFQLDPRSLPLGLRRAALLFWGNPHNPSGALTSREDLQRLLENCREAGGWTVVDEAFIEFLERPEAQSLASEVEAWEGLLVLRSFTKFYAIPGLRLGYLLGPRALVAQIQAFQEPWTVNALAQAVGLELCRNPRYAAYAGETRRLVAEERAFLARSLGEIRGLEVLPSQVNFLLIRIVPPQIDAPTLVRRVAERKVLVRDGTNWPGLGPAYFRVAVRTRPENLRLVEALQEVLGSAPPAGLGTHPRGEGEAQRGTCERGGESTGRGAIRRDPGIRGKAWTLMVLGTGSHVGKSLLVAALCRIFWQDGYRVAPFKAQNMALNSFVTRQGGEIGRAQAVQAQACGIEPTVEMNPILLKPTTEVGSQVIVRGRPIGHLKTDAYIAFKPQAFAIVQESLARLREAYDLVILEGAGSPAEVNLKAHDIVNLRMAEAAEAPAILVGDIDRGGVFASLIGTLDLLEARERERIQGLVINKFRGDFSLLRPGLDFLEARTGVPVLGVVPYLSGLKVAQEDSLGIPEAEGAPAGPAGEIAVRVIRLPHLSNFTDFDPLEAEPDVDLRYVSEPQELGEADLLILPGSKNTLADLAFLKERGFVPAIRRCLARGGRVIGICGGFQMLGRRLLDPLGVESPPGEMEGLGLLAATTRFESEKVTVQTRAIHLETGAEVCGYEIHMGHTWAEEESRPIFRVTWRAGQPAEEPEGLSNREGTVWGTYLHGLFDQAPFRRAFLNGLRHRKGLPPLEERSGVWDPAREFDRLADGVRQSLDIPALYRIVGMNRQGP